MIARPPQTDTAPPEQSDAPRVRPAVRPAVRELTPSAPAPVPPECSDPSGFGFAESSAQRSPVSVPDRRPARAPQGPPRWPHIAVAIVGPAAGGAGFLAAFLSSTMPFRVLVYAVIGGVVVVKVAGPVRAIIIAVATVIAKIGGSR